MGDFDTAATSGVMFTPEEAHVPDFYRGAPNPIASCLKNGTLKANVQRVCDGFLMNHQVYYMLAEEVERTVDVKYSDVHMATEDIEKTLRELKTKVAMLERELERRKHTF